MRTEIRSDLLPLSLVTVALIVTINLLPSSVLRVVLGTPFLVFIPGYAFIAMVFPDREALDAIERIALSFAASIALVPLTALAGNAIPAFGIDLESVLYLVSALVLVTLAVAWWRRRRLPEHERFSVRVSARLPRMDDKWNRALFAGLIVSIVGTIAIAGYVFAGTQPEHYSEFYILGPDGEAKDYQVQLMAGEAGTVTLGIVNQEHETVSYVVELVVDGARAAEIAAVELSHGQKYEKVVAYPPMAVGKNHEVEFFVYRDGGTTSYLKPLKLWVDVNE